MNAVRRFFGLFQNSPTFDRDRANLISGFTIGTTALVLNTAILIMVLPLMMNPNDRDFRTLTQNIEFGQLLGLILMGGATAFATMLIPMRLGTVFMGPRIGRYFDQIVLSGITPLRFLIGKVTSQNLFLALALFLLLPWFVLVLALGGLEGPMFLGNLILVWLYCMMLAMVMLWLSLHMNEILAMLMLMFIAAILCGLGCAPFPVQPFVVTPFPALMHSIYTAVGATDIDSTQTYFSAFASCALGMSIITCMAFAGIYLGPLYGIVRDNSTFGEVVKAGDSKRKRRFRFRLHIQRPSEIAFFYENRGNTFRRHEGLVRWGTTMICLLVPVAMAWTLFVSSNIKGLPAVIGNSWEEWWAAEFHVFCHVFHGLAMLIAVFLFSHARNTTYLQLPVLFGWKAKVAHLDWIGFALILFLSTTAAIGVPLMFNLVVAAPAGTTVFPEFAYGRGDGIPVDYLRVSLEGTFALSVAAVTVYLLQRILCLYAWLKSAAMIIVAMFYVGFVCVGPAVVGIFGYEMLRYPQYAGFRDIAMPVAAISPFVLLMNVYKESPPVWHEVSSLPFYIVHFLIIVVCVPSMWKRSRRLQLDYPVWMAVAAMLLCLTCSAPNAHGQADTPKQADFPGLDIQALPGWDGYVDLSAPVPFSFLISNFSQDTIEGELTLTNPENDRTLSLGKIFIGSNSVRRFSSIQALPDWYQCIAKFSYEGRILWQRELALTTGKDFSDDLNYLLFVDDGSRQLQLPISENAGGGAGRFVPEIGHGRAVQPLGVKTWQIPQHPGPLTVAQAIVFSETTKVDMINDAQWDAVGKWICLGGTVFVHDKSTEIIERLKKATPLAVQPAILFQELTVHRCGTGSIREYAGPLFSATDAQSPKQIAESASRLSRDNTISMLESTDLSWWESRNSEITRMWVVTVFVVYTLLSSSAIFLFRLSRRNITIFTTVIVGLTCVAAVILGGVLRTSRGDLRWVTITSAGPGGLLQLGKIDVQSAGGRNTQMTVNGRYADLQLSESNDTPRDDYYRYYYQPQLTQPHFPSFTWQASQLDDEADAWQIRVPINPWGRRRLYATAFQPLEHDVDIEVSYSLPESLSPEQAAQVGTTYGLNGKFRVKATSHLQFGLDNCRLIVAWTQVNSDVQGTTFNSGFSGSYQNPKTAEIQMEQVQSLADFGRLSPSVPVEIRVAPGSGSTGEPPAMTLYRRDESEELFPKVAYDGATSVWIVAQITKSPILSIDQQRSDFEPLQEQHWYVQEVLPEQMPPEWIELTKRILEEQLAAAKTVEP